MFKKNICIHFILSLIVIIVIIMSDKNLKGIKEYHKDCESSFTQKATRESLSASKRKAHNVKQIRMVFYTILIFMNEFSL